MLEELHGAEHVEHRRLLHPFRQGKEFSRNVVLFSTLDIGIFVLENLDHTLSTDCEILLIEFFWIVRVCRHQIVWPEISWAYLSSVAVEELDRHVGAILCKERYSLLACLDLLSQVPHW